MEEAEPPQTAEQGEHQHGDHSNRPAGEQPDRGQIEDGHEGERQIARRHFQPSEGAQAGPVEHGGEEVDAEVVRQPIDAEGSGQLGGKFSAWANEEA